MIQLKNIYKNLKYSLGVLVFLALCTSSALAVTQEFQLGYVFNAWDSNFIYRGVESRFPLSYKISGEDFSFRLSTAFVLGSYEFDSTPYTASGAFKGDDLSDTTVQASFSIPMGGGMKSNVVANVNIPTGNTAWEANAAVGSVPYIFDPSYYHGRGFGGDLFYFLSASNHDVRWGAGLGYLRTTTYYSSGIIGSDPLSYWGALVGMGTLGLTIDATNDISFRVVHNLPLQSTAEYSIFPFTLGQSTDVSAQWSKQMGRDRLQVTGTFSHFSPGSFTDPLSYTFIQESQAFLGNRIEVHPFLGWLLQPGVAMESGLNWRHVFGNGYDFFLALYNGGGDVIGAQQSITFEMDRGTFWNIGCLYEYIYNADAALNTSFSGTGVSYNRLTLGTNVGIKW